VTSADLAGILAMPDSLNYPIKHLERDARSPLSWLRGPLRGENLREFRRGTIRMRGKGDGPVFLSKEHGAASPRGA